ncbi:hypothetical protein, partial [Succinivibrio dextrinosolvens]|uniref:hypothetical protein n=1 Tax=Succinivibrio dextrinosolvens TaxID=83771 RepID=UPI001C431BFD
QNISRSLCVNITVTLPHNIPTKKRNSKIGQIPYLIRDLTLFYPIMLRNTGRNWGWKSALKI